MSSRIDMYQWTHPTLKVVERYGFTERSRIQLWLVDCVCGYRFVARGTEMRADRITCTVCHDTGVCPSLKRAHR